MPNEEQSRTLTQQLNVGMYTDKEPHFQPRGSYRFALNAVLETESGDEGALSSEQSNELCNFFESGFRLVGTHLKPDDTTIVFLTNDTLSVIGQLDSRCVYTELIRTGCLNLSSRHKRIDCIGRVIRGCEYNIYFTDEVNNYYSINLDNLQAYTNDGYTPTTANADPMVGWNCKLFNFFLDFTIPTFDSISVNETGGINKVGTKSFAIRYVAETGAVTPWVAFSRYVPIVDEAASSARYRIDGAYNLTSAVSNGVPPTNKSITINIGNLDTSYDYYQLAVVEVNSGLQEITDVFILGKRNIYSSSEIFTYTGYENQIDSQTTIADIEISGIRLSKVGSHEMTQERLILANTEEKFYDYSTFQQYASLIVASYANSQNSTIIDPLSAGVDTGTTSSSKSYRYYFDKTFPHDEVVAAAIVYYMEDGTDSPPFHIPGRPLDLGAFIDPSGTINYKTNTDLVADQSNMDYSPRNTVPNVEKWDSQKLRVVSYNDWTTGSCDYTTDVHEYDVAHLGIAVGDFVKRYKVHNTALNYPNQNGGILGYYDCGDEYVYPEVPLECSTNGVDYWGFDAWENPLVGTPIRHHRLPDTSINLDISGNSLTTINTLHMLFSNIQMPPGAIGYKIVMGERTQQNKTVHQKGICYLANKYYTEKDVEDSYISDNMFGYNQHYFHRNNPGSTYSSFPYDFASDEYSDSALSVYVSGAKIKGSKHLVFKSAESDFLKAALPGDYLKIESIIKNDVISYGELNNAADQNRTNSSALIKASLTDEMFYDKPLVVCNRSLSEYFYLDPDTYVNDSDGLRVSNMGMYNDCLYIKTLNEVPDIITTDDLGQPIYNQATDCDPDQVHPELITYCYYASIKSSAPVYTNLYAIEYIDTNGYVSQYEPIYRANGDSFVNSYFTKRIAYNESCVVGSGAKGARTWTGTNVNNATFRALLNVISESQMNVNLRHSYRSEILSYYYPRNYSISDNGFLAYLYLDELDTISPVPDSTLDLNYMIGGASCTAPYGSHFAKKHREQFIYNTDYSKHNDDKKYFPLPSSYKFCDNCFAKQKNRIWYSERSFTEDNLDNFRTIKANNYKDYFPEEGEITNLFLSHDNLYCQFVNTTALIPTANQELKTDNASNIYVGTGAFLSQPARRLVTTRYAYGGLNDKFSCVVTEGGAIYVDDKTGKIFSISEQEGLEEISGHGMRNWFEENIPLKFVSQFLDASNGVEYPYRTNTLRTEGIGFHAIYDTRQKRYIITKRDFTCLTRLWTKDANDTSAPSGAQVNDIVYNFYNGGFELVTSDSPPTTGVSVAFGDKEYFADESWTMSYSLKTKTWVSYHSYKPHLYYNTSETFYSVVNTGDGTFSAKHNTPHDYLSFYGANMPHVIDLINSQASTTEKYYDTVEYIGKVEKWDSINKAYIDINDVTFDKAVFYNRNQISLEHNLGVKYVPYQSALSPSVRYTLIVDRTEDYWRISALRDYSIGRDSQARSLFSSSWASINSQYITPELGYIDRVVNLGSVSHTKNVYSLERFKDKWLGVRLSYSNDYENRYKITTNVVNTNIKPSNR